MPARHRTEYLQDLRRLRRRHRVHASVDGEGVRHPARAGRPHQRQGRQTVGIQRHIGRRPIAAFGNSDGDLQMLQWTAGPGPRFLLYVHHTEAEREWAYDRKSHVGKLDKGSRRGGCPRLDRRELKNDWKKIYPCIAPVIFWAREAKVKPAAPAIMSGSDWLMTRTRRVSSMLRSSGCLKSKSRIAYKAIPCG